MLHKAPDVSNSSYNETSSIKFSLFEWKKDKHNLSRVLTTQISLQFVIRYPLNIFHFITDFKNQVFALAAQNLSESSYFLIFCYFLWITAERGYNPETPCNFPHHSSVMSIKWHAHLSYDWWRLPSGEAALASPCWKAPSNSSLDWTIVGVTLGPDSEVSVWVLGAQCSG